MQRGFCWLEGCFEEGYVLCNEKGPVAAPDPPRVRLYSNTESDKECELTMNKLLEILNKNQTNVCIFSKRVIYCKKRTKFLLLYGGRYHETIK
jgi:hypothetical protein